MYIFRLTFIKYFKEYLGDSTTFAISKWKTEFTTLKKEKKILYNQILEIREELEQAEKVMTCIEQLQEQKSDLQRARAKI